MYLAREAQQRAQQQAGREKEGAKKRALRLHAAKSTLYTEIRIEASVFAIEKSYGWGEALALWRRLWRQRQKAST